MSKRFYIACDFKDCKATKDERLERFKMTEAGVEGWLSLNLPGTDHAVDLCPAHAKLVTPSPL